MSEDQALRVLAVFLEVLILTSIISCILIGVRLILSDFGVGLKYNKILMIALITGGGILVVFFAIHLSVFYPSI